MKADGQPTLFDALPLGKGPTKRRGDSGAVDRHMPVFWQTQAGLWVVFYWGISTKQGPWFEGWEFPVFWCADFAWSASISREIPEHVLIWASEGDVEHDFYLNYERGKRLLVHRENWPSRDNRRTRDRHRYKGSTK